MKRHREVQADIYTIWRKYNVDNREVRDVKSSRHGCEIGDENVKRKDDTILNSILVITTKFPVRVDCMISRQLDYIFVI